MLPRCPKKCATAMTLLALVLRDCADRRFRNRKGGSEIALHGAGKRGQTGNHDGHFPLSRVSPSIRISGILRGPAHVSFCTVFRTYVCDVFCYGKGERSASQLRFFPRPQHQGEVDPLCGVGTAWFCACKNDEAQECKIRARRGSTPGSRANQPPLPAWAALFLLARGCIDAAA